MSCGAADTTLRIGIRGPRVPFFIRPITRMVATQVIDMHIAPTLQKHFAMLDGYLEKSQYIAGDNITGADAAMSFSVVALKTAGSFVDTMATWEKGTFPETYPHLWAYMGRIEQDPAWQKSVEKIKAIEGEYKILP